MSLAKMFHHVFTTLRIDRVHGATANSRQTNKIKVVKIIGMCFRLRWMQAKLRCHRMYRDALGVFEIELQYFLSLVVEPIVNWCRVLRLLFQLYILSLKTRILRAKLANTLAREDQLLRERSNLTRQQIDLRFKQIEHVLTQPGSRDNPNSILGDGVGTHLK